MKKLFIVLGLFVCSVCAHAYVYSDGDDFVTNSPVSGNDVGLRSESDTSQQVLSHKIRHGISVSFDGLYYFGDIAKVRAIFRYGAVFDNMGFSGALNYKMTINPYVSMRFGLQVGMLQGCNKKIVSGDETVSSLHEFKSTLVQEFVGVECYPILNYGFFIYAGFGIAESIISHYHHERRAQVFDEEVGGKIVGIVPMFHFGIGYNFWLNQNWTLGVELMGQIGMMDSNKNGLDAWPVVEDKAHLYFNLDKNSPRYDSEKEAYDKARRPDGWFQFGLIASYHF